MEETFRFSLNGRKTWLRIDPAQNLLWILRNKSGLTGTGNGSGMGFCGAHVWIIDAIQTADSEMKGGKL